MGENEYLFLELKIVVGGKTEPSQICSLGIQNAFLPKSKNDSQEIASFYGKTLKGNVAQRR